MLKIRLQRIGRINLPSYQVVVTEHARAPQTGNFVERLGSYNPRTKERVLNADRIKYWISVGAKPSDTMHNMLITEGVITGKKINVLPKKTVAAPAVAEGSGEAKGEPVAEVTSTEVETPVSTSVEDSSEAKEEATTTE